VNDHSCKPENQIMPIAEAIKKILLDTGDIELAKAVLMRATEHELFNRDGVVHIYEKVACIELIQIAEWGYEDYQPKKTTEEEIQICSI
tara:strand:+ start:589 stop:855 length:267 start_codon:yes stop_codon:yes gene_type:complete